MKCIGTLGAALLISAQLTYAQSGLNLKKGAKYQVETKAKTSTVMDMQGQAMEVSIDANTTMEVEVRDNKNNNYQLANKIVAIAMTMSQMGQEMSFDSKNPDDFNGPMGAAFKDVINREIDVEIDKSGKIVQVEKLENDALAAASAEFEASGYGAKNVFLALPKDVSVGKTWTEKMDADGSVSNTTYKVKSVSGNLVTLEMSGDMTVNKTIENMGMEITNNSKGTFTGELVVDKTNHVVQKSTTTIKTDGTSSVMGQEIPTSVNVTSTSVVKSI